MVESVACCGYKVWLLKKEEQRKRLTLETDYLRWSVLGVSRLQEISNTIIRSKMQAELSILDRIQKGN